MFWENLAFLEKKQWGMVNKAITYIYQNSNSELVRFSYIFSTVVVIIGGVRFCAKVW